MIIASASALYGQDDDSYNRSGDEPKNTYNYGDTDNNTDDNNNKDAKPKGWWDNSKTLHIDLGFMLSFGLYDEQVYTGGELINFLLSTRLTLFFDFGISAGNLSFGIEPVMSTLYTGDENGDVETIYGLEFSGRGFIRYSAGDFNIQVFGGYYYDLVKSLTLDTDDFNGVEAGIRIAFKNVTIDFYNVFSKENQMRFGIGYLGRLL